MRNLKKIFIGIIICALVILGSVYTGTVFSGNENVTVIRNEQIEITYNNQTQKFKDVTGKVVYPLSYEGTTYLPIRAISCLFELKIDWNQETNTVSLGKGNLDTVTAVSVPAFEKGTNEDIGVILNKDIKIEYLGQTQSFTDVTGKIVYPLSYEGTTYLPVRAISNLFGAKIEWIGEKNLITIEKEKTANWEGLYEYNKLLAKIEQKEDYITVTISGIDDDNVDILFSEDFEAFENEATYADEFVDEKRNMTIKLDEDKITVIATSENPESFFNFINGTYIKK
jgi:hypothetical protein